MVKIITYYERKNRYSRRLDGEPDISEGDAKKGKEKKGKERVFAEEELDTLLSDGWAIVSATPVREASNVLGSSAFHFSYLTVVLYKEND